ncbi:MAG TPA: DUF4124 domain-containing protein [Pseudoxanthomonas sp.]
MRALWAIAAGLLLGGGAAWWLSREAPEKTKAKQQRAERAAAAEARDARPSLYRWRDEAGVLQITDKPPQGRASERIDQEPDRGIEVRGDRQD